MVYRRTTDRPKRLNKAKSVSDALPRFLNGLDRSGGRDLVRLWRSWDELLGDVAQMARPLGHRGGRLVLAADDPIVMQEAHYLGPMILERVNGFLGKEVFDKVVFELLNGRVPLDGEVRPEAPEPPRKLKKPETLGSLNDKLDPDSPVGKCYRAYQRLFDDS
ncbi:DUF721 domain-containing protein [Desulfovibrio sp. Fe33]|uniref:DUF721 domain-containing protein n=1 Tax=Desulfovibrio sp. Fe33 TaxID=3020842 RepID=UPI00234CDF34|nr:DUF721 domain-containing protein [Desulfovibrio sp. Fe33]